MTYVHQRKSWTKVIVFLAIGNFLCFVNLPVVMAGSEDSSDESSINLPSIELKVLVAEGMNTIETSSVIYQKDGVSPNIDPPRIAIDDPISIDANSSAKIPLPEIPESVLADLRGPQMNLPDQVATAAINEALNTHVNQILNHLEPTDGDHQIHASTASVSFTRTPNASAQQSTPASQAPTDEQVTVDTVVKNARAAIDAEVDKKLGLA